MCLAPVLAHAGEDGAGAGISTELIQYQDFIYLHNVESGNINPTSISGSPISQIAIIKCRYGLSSGDFHKIDESGHTDGFSIEAFGIKRMKNMVFEGSLTYYNHNDDDRCWNSSLQQNPLNPFVLADSLPSDFNTERFAVQGRFSIVATPRLRAGLNAKYNVGVTSDEQDPRVETKGMRFLINPGIEFDLTPHISVGATGGLDLMNETARYSCVGTSVVYRFFLMSGLGTFYPSSGSSYQRDTKGTSWFAGGNIRYDISDRLSDNLSALFSHEHESATDGGSSYQFRGGDFHDNSISIANRLAISPNSGIAHNIELTLTTNSVKGKWFDQQSVTVNGSTHYEVMDVSVKHTEKRLHVGASYRFDMLDRQKAPSLTASLTAGLLTSNTKNYPDLYTQEYSRLDISAGITKHVSIKKVKLAAGIRGGYDLCLSSKGNFTGLTIEERYTRPMFEFLASSSFNVNGRIEAHLPVKGFIVGAHIDGGTQRCTEAESAPYGKSYYNTVECGLSLLF